MGAIAIRRPPLAHAVTHGAVHPMSERNVERIVSKYGDVARKEHPGIPKAYPHMVCGTRATTPCRDGVPTGQVSTPLGHQQTGTTRSHCAHPSPGQSREAAGRGGGLEPDAEREWVGHEEEIKRKLGPWAYDCPHVAGGRGHADCGSAKTCG